MYFLAALLFVIPAAEMLLNQRLAISIWVDLFILFWLLIFTIGQTTRTDLVYMWKDGIGVAYSYLPKPLANYENVRVFIPWRDIVDISANDDENGYLVTISFSKQLKSGHAQIYLPCSEKREALSIYTKLKDSRALHLSQSGSVQAHAQ